MLREPDYEGELVECEKCDDRLPPEALDEEGFCSACCAADEEARSDDRYFRSIGR